MRKPPIFDIAATERDFRAGVMTYAEIAAKHGISQPYVRKLAVRHGWERSLAPRVRHAAAAIVAEAEVVKERQKEFREPKKRGPKVVTYTPQELIEYAEKNVDTPERQDARAIEDAEIVRVNSMRVAEVQLAHRRDITRMRALVMQLLAECEAMSGQRELFSRLGEIMERGDANSMADAYDKVCSLPQRIKGVKELTDAMGSLVRMEREAYGIAGSMGESEGEGAKIDVVDVARRIAFAFARASVQMENVETVKG